MIWNVPGTQSTFHIAFHEGSRLNCRQELDVFVDVEVDLVASVVLYPAGNVE